MSAELALYISAVRKSSPGALYFLKDFTPFLTSSIEGGDTLQEYCSTNEGATGCIFWLKWTAKVCGVAWPLLSKRGLEMFFLSVHSF